VYKDEAHRAFEQARIRHWDAVASRMDQWAFWSHGYHRRLAVIYRALIPPGQRVLEIGCGTGDLLAALRPAYGVGVDFSGGMLDMARERHGHLNFVHCPADEFEAGETFDFIVCSDFINDLWDVQGVLDRYRSAAHPGTRLMMNFYSRLWEAPLRAAKAVGISRPLLDQNWLTVPDVTNLLALSNYEVVRHWEEIM